MPDTIRVVAEAVGEDDGTDGGRDATARGASSQPVVALLLREFDGGGAERALINLANGLAELGLEVDLLVLKGAGPFRHYLSPRVRVVELTSVERGALTLLAVGKLARYLRRRKPARLVSTLEALSIVAFFAHLLVGRSRDLVIRVATTFDREPRPLLRRILISLVYRWHRGAFVANAEQSAANLGENFAIEDGRLRVIHNAVDLGAIEEMSRGALEHGVPGGRFVLFAGRLTPAKRVDRLIRAVARLDASLGVKLVVLGDGPLREPLEALVAELGLQERVHMPGFAANPYAYMSRAAVFVLSSDYEGMPTVLIEALACGCPVVATDCVSGPREVLGGGEWGELVPVGDVEALAAAIERTLRDPIPADRLRERARFFSVPKAAEAYARLLLPGWRSPAEPAVGRGARAAE
jgi:glycosyltransferase involved in cell wall biosynthesis